MKLQQEGCNIIIIGAWNRRLFSPKWVGTNLFSGNAISVDVPISSGGPLRFSHDELMLLPDTNRLIVYPQNIEDDSLNKAESMALKIMDLLPHTPVSSFGLNFTFNEEDSVGIAENFSFDDNGKISENGFQFMNFDVKREFKYDDENCLNLSIRSNAKATVLDFNFHFDTASAGILATILKDRFVDCKVKALQLCKSIYDLTLEGE